MTHKDGKKWISALLSNEKAKKWLIVLLSLGIILIFLSEFIPTEKKTADKETEEQALPDTVVYVSTLEDKLETMIYGITGEKASVTLTAQSGYHSVLAEENKESNQENNDSSSQNRENSYIIVKNADGSQSTVQVSREEPEIRGVVVLCKGGNDPQTQQKVVNAVTTVLHISSARVCVLESNGGG